jgi:CheY-like chemotaxis protein
LQFANEDEANVAIGAARPSPLARFGPSARALDTSARVVLCHAGGETMGTRLLLVDDQTLICEAFELVLEHLGHEVTAVTTGAAALELIRTGRFDVVLTDLHLTDMSGFTLCERIRATRPETAVFVMSGDTNTDVAIRASRAGAREFVTKPVELWQLERMIGGALTAHDP